MENYSGRPGRPDSHHNWRYDSIQEEDNEKDNWKQHVEGYEEGQEEVSIVSMETAEKKTENEVSASLIT